MIINVNENNDWLYQLYYWNGNNDDIIVNDNNNKYYDILNPHQLVTFPLR